MFDTFDILISELSNSSRLNLSPDVNSSVAHDSKLLCVDDECFAEAVRAWCDLADAAADPVE